MEEKFFHFSETKQAVPLPHKGKICKLVFVGRTFLRFSSRDFPLVPSKNLSRLRPLKTQARPHQAENQQAI
jgi:hypothetical protein